MNFLLHQIMFVLEYKKLKFRHRNENCVLLWTTFLYSYKLICKKTKFVLYVEKMFELNCNFKY